MELLTKNRKLTRYGFSCGYTETFERRMDKVKAHLWMEHGVILVHLSKGNWEWRGGSNSLTRARELANKVGVGL